MLLTGKKHYKIFTKSKNCDKRGNKKIWNQFLGKNNKNVFMTFYHRVYHSNKIKLHIKQFPIIFKSVQKFRKAKQIRMWYANNRKNQKYPFVN